MSGAEPKKLALIRIGQILKQYSDYEHPLTQEAIADILDREYGIRIERKAIGRNLSLLKEAGLEIESCREGSYLGRREFEDAELRLLIDGVLCSRHITARHSKDLIDRLCGLSNRYFRAHVRNVYSVNDWNKTDNQSLFYNIELVDEAIARKKQLHFDYNKYGPDKKLHKSSHQFVSPFQLLLHNQRYYLMAYSEYWKHMSYYRLDHITGMELTELPLTPLKSLPGYEKGINYKELSASMPYMYSDKMERIEFIADEAAADQIVDWFGREISIKPDPEREGKVQVSLMASPRAMEHWAMQYSRHVEITAPESLRQAVRGALKDALEKYGE